MNAVNPTASAAAAGDVKVLSVSGRIGRVRYIGYSVGLWLVSIVAMVVVGMLIALLGGHRGGFSSLLLLAVYIAMAVVSFMFAIQRLHDFDTTGWLSLLLLIPVVNLIFWIVLMVVPGTDGSNRFGSKPPANSTGVIILAAIAPLLVIAYLAFLSAVVIPAYQSYVHRAKMAQQQYQSQQYQQNQTMPAE
jgi:uncharacterized membrane protein YhaH (DUF805 family)